jgi:hypothetical protein
MKKVMAIDYTALFFTMKIYILSRSPSYEIELEKALKSVECNGFD